MEKWLEPALAYIPNWLAYQMRQSGQPGVSYAITYRGEVVAEGAFGHADLDARVKMTPRHRQRVASHSKTFTAAGIMKLREQGRLKLDDAVGQYVKGLHPEIAAVTIAQLLSHTSGVIRDGFDSGQWQNRRPFLNEAEIRADLKDGPTIPPNTRFKYSNHGYGLAGMVIAAITGEAYNSWIAREIVAASGLTETQPDAPIGANQPFARGHSSKILLGRRMVIEGENSTHDLASATGFISTAADLARFFASLSPEAEKSVLSVASRREMTRRQWREEHSSIERWYGLGTISASLAGWSFFGHSGGFQGYITRTICVPAEHLSISVLTNAADGLSHFYLDGMVHILAAFRKRGAPTREAARWKGRWWSLWGAFDLLPIGDRVVVANPAFFNPLMDASEIAPEAGTEGGVRQGRIVLAGGFANHGEKARLELDARGKPSTFWHSGGKMLPERAAKAELRGISG